MAKLVAFYQQASGSEQASHQGFQGVLEELPKDCTEEETLAAGLKECLEEALQEPLNR